MPRGINCHPGWGLAACEWRLGNNSLGLCVEFRNRILGFDVDVHIALTIDRWELRLARQRNRRHNLLRVGIDYGCIVASPIERPNRSGQWLEDDSIWVCARGDRSANLVVMPVKYPHCISASVTHIAKFSGLIQRYAVCALEPGQGAHALPSFGVDDLDAEPMGDVHHMR